MKTIFYLIKSNKIYFKHNNKFKELSINIDYIKILNFIDLSIQKGYIFIGFDNLRDNGYANIIDELLLEYKGIIYWSLNVKKYDCNIDLHAFTKYSFEETKIRYNIEDINCNYTIELDIIEQLFNDLKEFNVFKINDNIKELSIVNVRNISRYSKQGITRQCFKNIDRTINYNNDFKLLNDIANTLYLPNIIKNRINNISKHTVKSFLNMYNSNLDNTYTGNLKPISFKICNKDANFTFGGAHMSFNKSNGYYYESNEKYTTIDIDVKSYYPSILLNYKLFNNDKIYETFKYIYDQRLYYKSINKKTYSDAFKLIINSVTGMLNQDASYNTLYDPEAYFKLIHIGQMLIYSLTYSISNIITELININTDSITVIIENTKLEKLYDIINEFEKTHKLKFDFIKIKKLFIQNTNEYILLDEFNNIKSRGDMFIRRPIYDINDKIKYNNNKTITDIITNIFINNDFKYTLNTDKIEELFIFKSYNTNNESYFTNLNKTAGLYKSMRFLPIKKTHKSKDIFWKTYDKKNDNFYLINDSKYKVLTGILNTNSIDKNSIDLSYYTDKIDEFIHKLQQSKIKFILHFRG